MLSFVVGEKGSGRFARLRSANKPLQQEYAGTIDAVQKQWRCSHLLRLIVGVNRLTLRQLHADHDARPVVGDALRRINDNTHRPANKANGQISGLSLRLRRLPRYDFPLI